MWLAVAALVIALAAILNIADVTGRNRQRRLVVLALAELGLQLLVIVVGLVVVLHPARLTDQLDLFNTPDVRDIVYSVVIATIAYAGIEAASDLAPARAQWMVTEAPHAVVMGEPLPEAPFDPPPKRLPFLARLRR